MKDRIYRLDHEDEQLTVRELLRQRLGFSGRLLRRLKAGGGVFLDDRPARMKERGQEGQQLSVRFPEEVSYFQPADIPLDVVYEDEELLVVNKQPGLVVHPTKNYQEGTLANALTHRMRERGDSYKIRFANRLDRDTSGLLMVAKNAHCQQSLARQMAQGQLRRYYRALVHGLPQADKGLLEGPIGKDPNHPARRQVLEGGAPSATAYRILQRFEQVANPGSIAGAALLEAELLTGRTHQIRVHLSQEGWPLVGDELYGSLFGYEEGQDWMDRQALHACRLCLEHPRSGEALQLEAPLPPDMAALLAELTQDDLRRMR